MKPPQDYLDILDAFVESGLRAVKIDGANREDLACFRMACYIAEDDFGTIDVLWKKGTVYLRMQNVSASN